MYDQNHFHEKIHQPQLFQAMLVDNSISHIQTILTLPPRPDSHIFEYRLYRNSNCNNVVWTMVDAKLACKDLPPLGKPSNSAPMAVARVETRSFSSPRWGLCIQNHTHEIQKHISSFYSWLKSFQYRHYAQIQYENNWLLRRYCLSKIGYRQFKEQAKKKKKTIVSGMRRFQAQGFPFQTDLWRVWSSRNFSIRILPQYGQFAFLILHLLVSYSHIKICLGKMSRLKSHNKRCLLMTVNHLENWQTSTCFCSWIRLRISLRSSRCSAQTAAVGTLGLDRTWRLHWLLIRTNANVRWWLCSWITKKRPRIWEEKYKNDKPDLKFQTGK